MMFPHSFQPLSVYRYFIATFPHGAGAAQLRGSSLLRRAEATETETKPVKRGPSEATCIAVSHSLVDSESY